MRNRGIILYLRIKEKFGKITQEELDKHADVITNWQNGRAAEIDRKFEEWKEKEEKKRQDELFKDYNYYKKLSETVDEKKKKYYLGSYGLCVKFLIDRAIGHKDKKYIESRMVN